MKELSVVSERSVIIANLLLYPAKFVNPIIVIKFQYATIHKILFLK